MIHQEKLKIMAQMAVYDKKKGKKDFAVYGHEEGDYIGLQVTKTVLAVIAAFVIILGFILLWNLDAVIRHFDTYNYTRILLLAGIAFLVLLCGCVWITVKRSKEKYNQVRPRVRRYFRNMDALKAFYEEKEKLQEEFEKGEWNDGQ